MEKRPIRNLLCQNPQFDLAFLEIKANKHGLKKTFQFRAFDLHSIAQTIYFNKKNKFHFRLNNKNSKLESDMDLTNILNFCGIKDNRARFIDGKMISEGNPHNALEDCKLTGESFSRLIYGKNLFPEYSEFEIPSELEVKEK